MRYISGLQALNLPCDLNTDGDWHQSALRWDKLDLRESNTSFFSDYGIEKNKKIPGWEQRYNAANHIRAILDLLAESNFSTAQGMRDDYINNEDYTIEIFDKIWAMRVLPNWKYIDSFIGKEYMRQWLNYKEEKLSDGRLAETARANH